MKISALALTLLCVTARADITVTQKMISKVEGSTTAGVVKTFIKGTFLRIETPASARVPKSLMVGNDKGFYSCLEKQRTCLKSDKVSPLGNGPSGAEPDSRLIKLDIKPLGTKQTVAGYSCEDYHIRRVSTVGPNSQSLQLHEDNTVCLSKNLLSQFPKKAIEEARNLVEKSASTDTIKKAARAEFALGLPMKRQSKVTHKATPTMKPTDYYLQSEITSVSTAVLSPKLFDLPAGYVVTDASMAGLGNLKGMRLPAEAIKKLREMKAKGLLPPEMEAQLKTLDAE
jgi:hypothetical protein